MLFRILWGLIGLKKTDMEPEFRVNSRRNWKSTLGKLLPELFNQNCDRFTEMAHFRFFACDTESWVMSLNFMSNFKFFKRKFISEIYFQKWKLYLFTPLYIYSNNLPIIKLCFLLTRKFVWFYNFSWLLVWWFLLWCFDQYFYF